MWLLALLGLLVAGCASAGGTAGIFDIGSVWYKHATTSDGDSGAWRGARPSPEGDEPPS
jgi:hypothetical protein